MEIYVHTWIDCVHSTKFLRHGSLMNFLTEKNHIKTIKGKISPSIGITCKASIFCDLWQGGHPYNIILHIYLPILELLRGSMGKCLFHISSYPNYIAKTGTPCRVVINLVPEIEIPFSAIICWRPYYHCMTYTHSAF